MESKLTQSFPRALPVAEAAGFDLVDTAFGDPSRRNNVVAIHQLKTPTNTPDCYTTMFRFGEDYKLLCDSTGSVRGAGGLSCWSDYIWFDVDRADLSTALIDARQILINLDFINAGLSESALVYFSGFKGFHIGVPSTLFGLEPSIDLPARIKRIALAIAGNVPIDTSIYEKNRLWRVPNTINSKSELYKVPLTYNEFAVWSIEQIKEKAKYPQGEAKSLLVHEGEYQPHPTLVEYVEKVLAQPPTTVQLPASVAPGKEPGWIATALSDLTEGNRNSTFAAIIGRLHRDGMEPADIHALLEPHAERCDFPLEELKREITGICSRYPRPTRLPTPSPLEGEQSEKRTAELEAITLSDLLQMEFAQPQWLVDSLFPSEGVGIVGGKPGIGKSWFLMDLARTCATGGTWLGRFQTQKCVVLYIDEESSKLMLQSRFKMLLAANNDKACQDIHFLVGKGLSFSSDKSVALMDKLMDQLKPNVVVIDSLIRVHHGEENSATEMAVVFGKVKQLVRKHKCLFVFADHHRKPGEREASADVMLRGSSEKLAFVDSLISLRSSGPNIVVEHSKARHSRPVESFVVSLEEPYEGELWLRVLGDRATLRKIEHEKVVMSFLSKVFTDHPELTRQQLVAMAKEDGIKSRILASELTTAVANEYLVREDRRPEKGRGGKTAHYRPTTTFPFSTLYKGENRKRENPRGGAS